MLDLAEASGVGAHAEGQPKQLSFCSKVASVPVVNVWDTSEVTAYFDVLYLTLAQSPTHQQIGWEALGKGYLGQLGFVGQPELVRMAELGGMRMGSRVLDLCCGTCGVALWYARVTGSQVTGLDCSAIALSIGQERARKSGVALQSVVGDITHPPFRPGSFDAVVCIDGFGAPFSQLFQECWDVLGPDGRLSFLLSFPTEVGLQVPGWLQETGFHDIQCQDLTAQAVPMLKRWLASYRRHAKAHVAEVGLPYHRALTEEMAALLRAFEHGNASRLLVSAAKIPQ
jgi:ubiquinone/menaquinone biosynthesis C-methylase UbiE